MELIYKGKTGLIRKESTGLTDLEFELGIRFFAIGSVSELSTMFYNKHGEEIVTEEVWSTKVLCLESNQPSHNLTKRYNDVCTERYDRGPYSRCYDTVARTRT